MFEGTSLDEAFAAPMDPSALAIGTSMGTMKPSNGSGAPRYDPNISMEMEQAEEPHQQSHSAHQVHQAHQPVRENFVPQQQQEVPLMNYVPRTPPAHAMMQYQQRPAQGPMMVPGPVAPRLPTLWDRMMEKRIEVAKLVIVGLVVVFALSLDRTISYYIQEYLSRSVLTETKEVLVRAAYPLGILLLLWILKSI